MSKTITVNREEYIRDQAALELLSNILGWGSRDIDTAVGWLERADATDSFGEFVEQECNDIGIQMSDVDVAALALIHICRKAFASDLAGRVYGNYMCSDFDISEEDAGTILYAVPEEDRNTAWQFLVDFTNAVEPKEDG